MNRTEIIAALTELAAELRASRIARRARGWLYTPRA